MTQIKEKIQELTQRNFFIDNIRGILIMLVIIGHYLELFFAFSIIKSLFIFIYLFHIPLFVAISGYLSKENFSLLKNFKKILLPYIIFQIIYVLLAYLLHDEHIGTFTIPFWFLWYLPALFVWRFLIYIFKKINLYVLLGSSVLISFLVGAVNYIGYELTLSRIIFFFPWFVLGFLMNKYKKNIKQIHLKPINVVLILTIIFGICFLYNTLNKYWLFGSLSYENMHANYLTGFFIREVIYIIGIILIVCMISIITKKQINFLTGVGTSTMIIYLIHGFFIMIISAYLKNYISSTFNPIIIIIQSIVLAFLICAVILKIQTFIKNRVLYYEFKRQSQEIS